MGLTRRFSRGRGGIDANEIVRGILRVETDDHFFGLIGGENQAAVVGRDGKTASAAINEDGELDLGRTAVIEELVEGGFDGATGKKNVVHQNHRGAGDVRRDVGRSEFLWDRMAGEVVAMKGNIQDARACGEPGVKCREPGGDAAGQLDAAVGDAEEQQARSGGVPLGNGGSQPVDRGVNLFRTNGIGWGHERF